MERGEGETHQCVVASHMAPTGDLAHNPGMCLDWESNQRPFGSQPALNPQSYSSQDWPLYILIEMLVLRLLQGT